MGREEDAHDGIEEGQLRGGGGCVVSATLKSSSHASPRVLKMPEVPVHSESEVGTEGSCVTVFISIHQWTGDPGDDRVA